MAIASSSFKSNTPLPTILRRAGVDPADLVPSHPLFRFRYTRDFFDKCVAALYRPYVSPNSRPHIMVASFIMEDGFGDLARVGHVYDVIKREFPSWTLCAGGKFSRYEERKDRAACVTGRRFEFYPCNYLWHESGVPHEFTNPDIVVNASVFSGVTFSKQPFKTLCFYEYNYDSTLETTGVQMQHSGLLFSPPVTQGLHELMSAPLKSLLLGCRDASIDNAREYSEKTHVLYGYFGQTDSFSTAFLLATCSLLKDSSKNIDLITSNPTEEYLDKFIDYFKEMGVGQIDLYRCHQDHVFELTSSIHCSDHPESTGKTIRLIISPFLMFQDVQILMSHSHRIAGCIGDSSFSEAISYGKLPFYHIYIHKTDFYNDFITLSQTFVKQSNQSSKNSYLVNYLKLIRKINSFVHHPTLCADISSLKSLMELFSEYVNSPKLEQEFKQFRTYLMENYNANKEILNAVSQAVVHLEHPSLKIAEDRIFEDYSSGESSAVECIARVARELNGAFGQVFSSMKQEDPEILDLDGLC